MTMSKIQQDYEKRMNSRSKNREAIHGLGLSRPEDGKRLGLRFMKTGHRKLLKVGNMIGQV